MGNPAVAFSSSSESKTMQMARAAEKKHPAVLQPPVDPRSEAAAEVVRLVLLHHRRVCWQGEARSLAVAAAAARTT